MAEQPGAILPRPLRRRRPSFVLTSLIDVIFLLVIFFMVSSQIVPFSLLPLGPLAAEGPAAGASETRSARPIAVRILAGRVAIGGDSIAMAEVGDAFAALKAQGATSILLMPATTATVQDVVTVLEASRQAALGNVTVLGRRGGAP
jgi:biopolymer transport protein ExbD